VKSVRASRDEGVYVVWLDGEAAHFMGDLSVVDESQTRKPLSRYTANEANPIPVLAPSGESLSTLRRENKQLEERAPVKASPPSRRSSHHLWVLVGSVSLAHRPPERPVARGVVPTAGRVLAEQRGPATLAVRVWDRLAAESQAREECDTRREI
jgi:hypothetical protein